MTRWLLTTCLLLACTKARTDNVPTPGSASVASARTPSDATSTMPVASGSAGAADSPDPGVAVTKIGSGAAGGPVGMYQDPNPVDGSRLPSDDLSHQLGSAQSPAKGGRSLVVIKRVTALDTSSLDATAMELAYVARGRADVKQCFETLRAKDPAAKGEVTLRFTVDTTGAVVHPEVTGFRSDVTQCVEAAMPQWKFTAPDKPTRFELVLDLVVG